MSSLIVPVVKINKIEKHDNADRLEIAQFEGSLWSCIIGKGDFKIGDTAVYIPIDSVISEELVKKYNIAYLKKNERVRAVKLRGVISYGLLVSNDLNKNVGTDMAEEFKIIKWEPPVRGNKTPIPGTKRKANPFFDKYTDMENIKNYPDVLKEGEDVVITEKIHGMNYRVGWLPKEINNIWDKIKTIFTGKYEFVVGSHNVQSSLYNENNTFVKIANKYKLKEKTKDYPGLIFYGEIYGKGIQHLTYNIEDVQVRFFDIKSITEGKYLDYPDVRDICDKLDLERVPLIQSGPWQKKFIIELATGKSNLADHIIEGIVIKPYNERYDHKVGRVILKSINPEYLLDKKATDFH